ncbi:MAG: hypothetical protein JXR10_04655 [Cyclobacteriaceae bacterium]
MKNFAFLTLIALIFLGTSSFNSTSAEDQLLPTKLRITVLDGLGNITEGVTVVIYKDQEEYRNGENPVAEGITDKKGRITFDDVKPIHYFIDARKGDMNNDGEGVRTDKLQEGRLNKVNTVIE